ncbi:SLAC1 family transporter [Oceanithermus sp.]
MKLPGKYHPLYMLSSLGAGGLAVAFWKLGDVTTQSSWVLTGQVFFLLLAIILLLVNLPFWWKAFRANLGNFFGLHLPHSREEALKAKERPPVAAATGWMALPAAYVMILNASFAVVPTVFQIQLKEVVFLGFWLWILAVALVSVLGLQIMLNSFAVPMEISEFHLGLFLQPLAYGLVAIPGVRMAAMLPGAYADASLIIGVTLGALGTAIAALVTTFAILRFMTAGLPDPEAAPTTLLMMPAISVYTILTLFTLHYVMHHGVEVPHVWFKLITAIGWGMMAATTTVGLLILVDYFRHHVPLNPSWWAFVCPFVAFSVMNSLAYQQIGAHPVFLWLSLGAILFTMVIYFYVAYRTIKVLRG